MFGINSPALRCGTLAALLLGCTALTTTAPAWGQESTQRHSLRFDIAAKPLPQALAEFSAVSGLRVLYTAEEPFRATSPGLAGSYAPEEALRRLLAGTGVTYRFTNPTTITLEKAPAEGALMLDPVTVEGAQGAARGLGDGSTIPPAFAGGQVARGSRLGLLGNTDYMDAPVSTTSYTQQRIADQQAKTIADVVKNDPSVRTLSSSSGMLDSYAIRGFPMNTGNSGEVALNGVFGLAPTYRAQTGFAERVEVLKGPSALLTGMAPNSGVGGVINVVPKRAEDTPLNRVTTDFGQGSQIGTSADVGRRYGDNKEFGIRLNTGIQGGETYVDNQTNQTTLGALALDYRGRDLRATLDVIDQRQSINTPSRELQISSGVAMPSAPDGSKSVVNRWEWSDAIDQSALLGLEYDVNDAVTVFAHAGAGTTEVDRLFGYPTIRNSNGNTTDSVSYMRFQTDRQVADAGLRGAFSTGPVNHRTTVQLARYEDTYRRGATNNSTVLSSNIYQPSDNAPVAVARPENKPKLSETQLTGIALADTLGFWDDHLQLVLGARHQRIQSDNFSATSGAVTSSYDDSAISPMAGIVVKPWSTTSFYANYIEGLSKGDIAPSSASNAGQAMAPYVAKQMEAGVKFDFGQFGMTAAAFSIVKPFGQTVGGVYSAGGEQRNRGLELGVFGEVTPEIRLLGGVMFLDAELTKTDSAATKGNRPVGTPELQANLTAEWDTPFVRGLTLNATVTHTSSQYVNTANTQSIPEWTTLDLGAKYRTDVGDTPMTVRAVVQNVTNEAYWSSVNSWSMVSLGAPRTFLLSTAFDF